MAYREPEKPEGTDVPEKLWHVLYLATNDSPVSQKLVSFDTEEQLRTWLLDRRPAHAYSLYGHAAKVRIRAETVYSVHLEPVKS